MSQQAQEEFQKWLVKHCYNVKKKALEIASKFK
jgi:hypothetical protein